MKKTFILLLYCLSFCIEAQVSVIGQSNYERARYILHHEEGTLDSALYLIDLAIEEEGEISEYYHIKADVHFRLAELEKAHHAANKAIELSNYKSDSTYVIRMGVFMRMWKRKKAEKDFETVLRLNPQNTKVYLYMGRYLRFYKEYERSEEYLSRYLASNNNDVWAYSYRGDINEILGDIPEAILDFRKCYGLVKNSESRLKYESAHRLGNLYFNTSQYDSAQYYLAVASAHYGENDFELLLNYGVCLFEQNFFDTANKVLAIVGAFDLNEVRSYTSTFYSGLCEKNMGDYALALSDFKKIIIEGGRGTYKLRQMAHFEYAKCFIEMGIGYEIAEHHLNKLRKKRDYKRNAEYLFYLSFTQYQLGRNSKTICSNIEKALKIGLDDSEKLSVIEQIQFDLCKSKMDSKSKKPKQKLNKM